MRGAEAFMTAMERFARRRVPLLLDAIELGDAGHKVILVEKEPTIGGIMAQLDKTYPTMDCSI